MTEIGIDGKAYHKIGMKPPVAFACDSIDPWYEYLINEYIPEQNDQTMFIDLGFSPYNYILWKIYKTGHMKKKLIEPFKARIKEVFNIVL